MKKIVFKTGSELDIPSNTFNALVQSHHQYLSGCNLQSTPFFNGENHYIDMREILYIKNKN